MPTDFFRVISSDSSNDLCFICHREVIDRKTDEHIIPKWILNKYNIWNKNIILFNGTKIPVSKVKIICCDSCNNIYLSRLESSIKKHLEGGYQSFNSIDRMNLWQWICKINYGLIRKQHYLLSDRKNPQSETIVDEWTMRVYQVILFLMQSIVDNVVYEPNPWSIFIFDMHKTKPSKFHFSSECIYNKNIIVTQMILDDIGIICVLNDYGLSQYSFNDVISKILPNKIFEFQLQELFSIIYYNFSLLENTFDITMNLQDDKTTISAMMMSKDRNHNVHAPTYREWNNDDHRKILHDMWIPSKDIIYKIFGQIPESTIFVEEETFFFEAEFWDVDKILSFYEEENNLEKI